MARFLLAPIVGLLFVVLLPFIGLAMLVQAVARALTRRAREGARDLAATVAPGWRPGEAHLTGRPPASPPGDDMAAGGAGEEALEDVAHEIAARRSGDKAEPGD
jgi:hypothetical protein